MVCEGQHKDGMQQVPLGWIKKLERQQTLLWAKKKHEGMC